MFGYALTDEGKKLIRSIGIILIAAVFITALTLPSLFLYRQNRNLENQLAFNLPPNQMHEITTLVSKVGKLITLPPDEIPTVITVTDTNILNQQPFFAKAKNGDTVLVYIKAKKAFLYDPVADKILEVGPLIYQTPDVSPPDQPLNVIGASTVQSTPSSSISNSPKP